MAIEKLKCGCKVTEEGYLYSECKYHETHCHYNIDGLSKCRRKLKKGEHTYCKQHDEMTTEQSKSFVDAFGGSDF